MSTKLLLPVLFLAVFAAVSVDGDLSGAQRNIPSATEVKNGFRGAVSSSERHLDEQPEYELEKGTIIRAKRAPPAVTNAPPKGKDTKKGSKSSKKPKVSEKQKKRVKGFVTIFSALTGTLVFLCIVNVGLFIWLSITLKKVRK